ncbi:MAG: PTS sugar transporter subunit IIA [[Clostridium] innocuum]
MVDNIYVIEGNPVSWKEAIQMTADELYKNGCVEADFYQNCIKREQMYPTGLATLVPVAIPHAESCCSIHKNGICLLRLATPVSFHRMDNTQEELPVDFVLNLAVMDGAVQLRALQNTINLFQDKEFQSDIRKLKLLQLKKVFVDKWKPES